MGNAAFDQAFIMHHPPADQIAKIFADVIDHIGRIDRHDKEQFANLNLIGGGVMI